MDFELPEDLKMIRTLAHDFVAGELRPLERDLLGRSADLSDARSSLPHETERALVAKARAIGLWGPSVPEALGGAGLGVLANCLIEEELAQTIVPFDFGDVTPLLFDCNEYQRIKYFAPAFDREKQVLLALTEAGRRAGTPLVSATAARDGSHYVLSGVKVALGSPGAHYFAVVIALAGARKLPTCFFVDEGTPGLEIQRMAVVSRPLARLPLLLKLNDCRISESDRLGDEGKAFSLGKRWLPYRRIVRGARAVGAAQRLLEEATTRALTSESFGRPLSERQGVRAALAEIATAIHACRLLVYQAAWKADQGGPVKTEASMVKLFAGRMIRDVAESVAHVYGGPGNVTDMLCQDALTISGWSSAEVQRNVIARGILNGLKT